MCCSRVIFWSRNSRMPLLEERAVDLVELGVAERLGEIDALDLGAQGVAQRTEGKRHGDLFGERGTYHALPGA